jgi:hypothetical protein
MAISDTQKVDFLWKKIAYGKAKTDVATSKQGFEESIASPLLIRGDRIWQQSGSIPASIATSSSVVTVYSGTTTVECTEDSTSAYNRTWLTNLTDWISPEFGADYIVSVYIATSGITGSNKTTQVTIPANKITAAGVNDDQWYFDYQSGVLNFIGTNEPTGITGSGKSIYITGARYTGGIGFGSSSTTTATTATLGNLYISGNTLSSTDTNANINLSPNGTGNVVISGNVSAGNLVTATYFSGNGSLLTGVAASTATYATTAGSTTNLANGSSNVNIASSGGNITMAVGGTANVAIITTTGVNIAGYVNLGSGNLTTTGNASASYFLGNGSQLTGITSSYSNSNVATYLAAYTGNLTASNVSFTGSNVTLGDVGNLHITGGTNGYFLKTDGSGGLSWGAQSSLTADVDNFTGDGTATAFTLAKSPSSGNYTIVAVQGVLQPKSSYTVSGNTLTFSGAPPNTAIIEVTTFGGSVSSGGGGTSSALTWNIASSNATMTTNNGYFVDTSGGAKTMTLPSSATLGDTIRINDLAGTFNTNNLTVAANGNKIQGVAQDLLVDINQSSFGLVYSNSTYGWKVLEL